MVRKNKSKRSKARKSSASRRKTNAGNPVFEIFVVLAIVAIVAITGQVMIFIDEGRTGSSVGSPTGASASNGITGFAVSQAETEHPEPGFTDIAVSDISLNPPSPLLGKAFEITVTLSNLGKDTVKTPFYIETVLKPEGKEVKPTVLNTAVSKIIPPGEEAKVVYQVAMVTKEGPMKIAVNADPAGKLADDNSANNLRTKTVIITAE